LLIEYLAALDWTNTRWPVSHRWDIAPFKGSHLQKQNVTSALKPILLNHNNPSILKSYNLIIP